MSIDELVFNGQWLAEVVACTWSFIIKISLPDFITTTRWFSFADGYVLYTGRDQIACLDSWPTMVVYLLYLPLVIVGEKVEVRTLLQSNVYTPLQLTHIRTHQVHTFRYKVCNGPTDNVLRVSRVINNSRYAFRFKWIQFLPGCVPSKKRENIPNFTLKWMTNYLPLERQHLNPVIETIEKYFSCEISMK